MTTFEKGMSTENMMHQLIEYKGYTIKIRIDVPSNSCQILKAKKHIKYLAGDILGYLQTNIIEKAKLFIDKL